MRRCRAGGARLVLSLALAGAVVFSPAEAEAPKKTDAAAETKAVSAALNNFYKTKKPEVGELLLRWERLAATDQAPAVAPMLGFLAAYFERNPGQIDKVASRPLGRKGQTVMLISLAAAGNEAAARRIAGKWKWSDEEIAKLKEIKPLEGLVPAGPSDLDTLWGAAFASGDAGYVRKIYKFYADIANDPKVEFGDIVLVIQARATNKLDQLRGIGERYPPEMAQKIVFASAAIWSLLANAGTHPFVKAELDRAENEEKATNAVKAIVALRQVQ